MSRHYDLMRGMERKQAFGSGRFSEAVFTVPGEECHDGTPPEAVSDSALRLVEQIFLRQTKEPPRMVVFTGIDHRNGCSQIAASVAEALAVNSSRTVCLVEANFRSPALSGMLRTTNHYGLANALMEEGSVRPFIEPVGDGTLWLLSAGSLTEGSPQLLTSARMKDRAAELRQEFDFVIVDAPPLTRYADAISLAQLSDGIVLVLEADSTRREAALMAVNSLRSSQIPILGAVLNKRTFPIPEQIYNRL